MSSTINTLNANITTCESVINNPNTSPVQKREAAELLHQLAAIKRDIDPAAESVNKKYNPDVDEVSFSNKSSVTNSELSVEDKQAIMKKAKTSAAGWSVFGGVLSSLYYASQSNKNIAEKYGLDPESDKEFIKNIKDEQIKSTIPGVLGLGALGWIYNKCKDEANFDVD